MPELPEAETIGRALKRVIVGRKIVEVRVFSPAMREPLTPLLDAERVDEWRREVGMGPVAEYLKRWGIQWPAPEGCNRAGN